MIAAVETQRQEDYELKGILGKFQPMMHWEREGQTEGGRKRGYIGFTSVMEHAL